MHTRFRVIPRASREKGSIPYGSEGERGGESLKEGFPESPVKGCPFKEFLFTHRKL